MSGTEHAVSVPHELLNRMAKEITEQFTEQFIALIIDEGKSQRYAIRRAGTAAQRSIMLSGQGVFEKWEATGQIDGAINTEEGPITFIGGTICGREEVDIQSGPLTRWESALEPMLDAIRSAADNEKASDAVDTHIKIWLCLERTTNMLITRTRRAWPEIDAKDQPTVLRRLPATFKDRLELHSAPPAFAKRQQPPDADRTGQTWLMEAVKLETAGQSEESLDIIFDKLDDWLLDACFDQCSSFLSDVPVGELSTPQLLTILTATLPASTKLPERPAFYNRVHSVLRQRGEDAGVLLSGLEG